MKLDKKIFETVLYLLREQPETPPEQKKNEKSKDKDDESKKSSPDADKEKSVSRAKISAQGAFGKGSWSKQLQVAESRAIDDPSGLVKDLGIKSATGNSDLKKASNVIEQAVNNNNIMKEAFNDPTIQTIKTGNRKIEICQIVPANPDVSYRNAAKYIYLTLVAAENAGILKMKRGVRFANRATTQYPTLLEI